MMNGHYSRLGLLYCVVVPPILYSVLYWKIEYTNNNDQNIYKNRTLTYDLQQPAQEIDQPRKPACYKLDLQEVRLLSLVMVQEARQ